MNSIMMVDGYDLPFDGAKKKGAKKKSAAKKHTKRRSKKSKGHKGASFYCAGAKRRSLCMKKLSSLAKRAKRKCAK